MKDGFKSKAKLQAMKIHSLLAWSMLMGLFFACGNKAEREESHTEQVLAQAFEKNWGIKSATSDSIRMALANLPARNQYTLYCRAWKMAGQSRLTDALKSADSLVMGFPRFEKGIFLRANLRLENGDTSGSMSDFERCLKRNPRFFECLMNRGSLFFSSRMPDLAYKDFKEAVRLKPQNPEALRNLGNSFLALGQPDSACRYWKQAQDKGATNLEVLMQNHCPTNKK